MLRDAWVELINIGRGVVAPVFDADLILQTAPTRTLLSTGWVGQHGILVGAAQQHRALAGIGVANQGWARVEPALSKGSTVLALVKDGCNEHDASAAAWALESNQCFWFPITKWDLLPPMLKLSEYDVGHRVVMTMGELMGQTGRIVRVQSDLTVEFPNGQQTLAIHDSVAVLLDDDPVKLAPMRYLYPAGTQVWTLNVQRAGLPYTWTRGTALGMQSGHLMVLRHDTTTTNGYTRQEVAPGDLPKPPDGPIARTVRGARPVPRLRPGRGKVPPAAKQ